MTAKFDIFPAPLKNQCQFTNCHITILDPFHLSAIESKAKNFHQ